MSSKTAKSSTAVRSEPIRLAVLISGGGTTLQNLVDRIASGQLQAKVAAVICSNEHAYETALARNLDLPVHLVNRKDFPAASAKQHAASERSEGAGSSTTDAFSDVVFGHIRDAQAELVCLAGFLSLLTIPDDFVHRVLNIHPALLPAFGGPGMYGQRVHQAVLDAGCKVSGCTVHFADQTYDTGPILVQRTCPVLDDDSAQTLAERVFEQECLAYPEAIEIIAQGRVVVAGKRARVLPGEPLMVEADEALVRRAAQLCIEAHVGQQRDGGKPYSEHPIAVAQILRRRGVQDPAVIAAAYLHDTLEDTPVTLDQLRETFGSRVADLVHQMTNPDKPDRSFEQKHYELLEHARKMTPDCKLIKLADRLDNLRDLHQRPPHKQARYARVTLDLLEALNPWPTAGDAMAEEIRTLIARHIEEDEDDAPNLN